MHMPRIAGRTKCPIHRSKLGELPEALHRSAELEEAKSLPTAMVVGDREDSAFRDLQSLVLF
ncbi:hypothetical protein M404DRAFT_1007148 [Pisolithus tinctorius Marx 270]|uniref:Uncharacterized protein n=1 Tax=Pisolithus tinctorius Marx 270 TaxID=870435 RepID=A0A0C3NJD5_PISTI|nr:hypothetical protein M404DRAFT_1007148 [Pisolithus tinctorius Marx 270]